ncbi:MAG: amino acid adenylation domain-containing protein [Verrucomicrobiota bacterium]|nr:amino acid adenylation domain-containing protein [Verrucomicrobiota bacterium]
MRMLVAQDQDSPLIRSELLRLHYQMQTDSFISELKEQEDWLHIRSEASTAPIWNHSAYLGDFRSLEKESVEQVVRFAAQGERLPAIYLAVSAGTEVPPALLNGAYERFDRESWMIHSGGRVPSRETGLEIRLVHTAEEMDQFIDGFYSAYQTKDPGYSSALRKLDANRERGIFHFLGLAGEKVAAVGTIIQMGRDACIYNLGTVPDCQGRGFGDAMMRCMLNHAYKNGARRIMLQVESGGHAQRLYQRLGFSSLFERVGYRLANWKRKTQTTASINAGLLNILATVSRSDASNGYLRQSISISPELGRQVFDHAKREQQETVQPLAAALGLLLARYTEQDSIHFAVYSGESEFIAECKVQPEFSPKAYFKAIRFQSHEGRGEQTEVALCVDMARSNSPVELVVDSSLSQLEIHVRSSAVNKDLVRRLLGHFLTLLEGLTQTDVETIGQLSMLTRAERQQLLVSWNERPKSTMVPSVQQLFEAQVERTPEAIALVSADHPGEELSYRQLNRRANQLAHYLQRHSLGPEQFVAVYMDRSLDMIVSLLAIWKAGAACVPLDPAYPIERIVFMLEDTAARIVLTTSGLAQQLPDGVTKKVQLDTDWPRIDRESEKNAINSAQEQQLAYVIYTSGSTGKPKGVGVSHQAIAQHSVDSKEYYGLSGYDRVLQFSSFNFDAALEQIVPALIAGSRLIVRGPEVWTSQEFNSKLVQFGLTVADIPTAYWHDLVEQWHANPSSIPNHALRLVIVGGEAIAPEKLALWHATSLRQVRLVNAYGPTETTITATAYEIPAPDPLAPPLKFVPIGTARGNRKLYVLDRQGNPVPIGLPGELHIGGPLLAKGYLNRPDLTEARFIPNEFSDNPDERLYKTGDLVRYREDGNLEFLGRLDDQVKIRGFRIELGEIESALLQHPDVREAALLARPDSQGEKRLVAYVTLRRSQPRQQISSWLKSRLPGYMVPSAIIILEQLPIMPNGKVDRRALPSPDEYPEEIQSGQGPRTPMELQLQILFERVLKKAPIGVEVSFFELGGDSLQALELLVQVEKATGKNLPLGTLFQASSIEALAKLIQSRNDHSERWSALVPLQTSGTKPPLYFVHTTPGDVLGYGGLIYHLGADQPCYGFQSLGLKKSELSHRRIEAMAEYYVERLKAFQPKGPYYLAGWCYGGVVAVEMARQLRVIGDRVAFVGLMETVAMAPGLSNFRYYLHRLHALGRMSPTRWAEYVREKIKYRRNSKIANRMRFRQVSADQSGAQDPWLLQLEHVYNTNLAALNGYRSRWFDGKVTLFNAADQDPALIPDPQYGWVGLAREIEIHSVPGNHDTMLSEPHVRALAAEFQRCLAAAFEKEKQS